MSKPTEAYVPHGNGFYSGTPDGWVTLHDSTINGDGFSITFSRLVHRTIDRYCDALNGYYVEKTDLFDAEFTSDTYSERITCDGKSADKLYAIFSNIKPYDADDDDAVSAKDVAITSFRTLASFVRGD